MQADDFLKPRVRLLRTGDHMVSLFRDRLAVLVALDGPVFVLVYRPPLFHVEPVLVVHRGDGPGFRYWPVRWDEFVTNERIVDGVARGLAFADQADPFHLGADFLELVRLHVGHLLLQLGVAEDRLTGFRLVVEHELDGLREILVAEIALALVDQVLGCALERAIRDRLQRLLHAGAAERRCRGEALGPRDVLDQRVEGTGPGQDVLARGQLENFRLGDGAVFLGGRAAQLAQLLEFFRDDFRIGTGDLTLGGEGLQFLDGEGFLINRVVALSGLALGQGLRDGGRTHLAGLIIGRQIFRREQLAAQGLVGDPHVVQGLPLGLGISLLIGVHGLVDQALLVAVRKLAFRGVDPAFHCPGAAGVGVAVDRVQPDLGALAQQ